MSVAAAVLSVLLALVSLAAGAPKTALKGPGAAAMQEHLGLGPGLVRFVGLAEVAAALGLVVGIFRPPLGIAAALGFAAVMVGAVGHHAKAGDYADPKARGGAVAPIVLAVLAVATAVVLGLSL